MARFNFAEITTVSEAARLWHVNRRTLQRWCDFGYVDAVKIDGVWIIATRSLVARCGMPDVGVRNAVDRLQSAVIS